MTDRRIDYIFLVILLGALVVRLQLASTQAYVHDEENTAIPLSKTISFEPGNLHLPLRGENHGALPAYVVKASSSLFGTSPLAYRALHVALALVTIGLIYLMVRPWYGPVAARWGAALLAFNEYYLAVSSRATAHVPHLGLAAAAVYFFARFIRDERPRFLYLAGLAVGLAFYCKEHSALLLPVFFATLFHPAYRRWLRSAHVYLACLVFVLVIAPDLYWNVTTNPETSRVTYSDQVANQATYQAHLRRLGGVGFSPYPSMFYAYGPVVSVHQRITGQPPRDETTEYPAMNSAIGVLLLGSALLTLVKPPRRDAVRVFLLIMFWGIFGFFSLIAKGSPPGRLDPVSWIWVEVTMIAAVALAGARLADVPEGWKAPLQAGAGVALLYGVARTIL